MEFRKIVSIAIYGIGMGGGFSLGEAWQQLSDLKETRGLAISHECGAYDPKTGIFGWVKPVTAEDMMNSIIVDSPSLKPPSDLSAHPTPRRKPSHGDSQ